MMSGAHLKPPPLPIPRPTRDQVCNVRHQFQGMSVQLPEGSQFDPIKALCWFDPLIMQTGDKADRLAVYQAHRLVADTHLNLSLDLGGLVTLPFVLQVAREAIVEGGITGIILCCMGDGYGNPNSDPGALGYEWLMRNFMAIYAAAQGVRIDDHYLSDHIIFVPGYDGVVPDWQPASSVDRFLLMARRVIDQGRSGYLGLELSAGYCKWGHDDPHSEENNWITPAGGAVDVILQEFPIDMGPPIPVPNPMPPSPERDRWTQVYSMVGRMVSPFNPVPGQSDDLHPPFLLAAGTPRGLFKYVAWEYDTYRWTLPWRRGGPFYPIDLVHQHRQSLYVAGCQFVG